MISQVDAGVEATVALDSQAGGGQLGVPLDINEVKEGPGGWPVAEVQSVQPERVVHGEDDVVIHDDALRRLPQPLRGGESEGGSRGRCLCALSLNSHQPSHRSAPHGGMH